MQALVRMAYRAAVADYTAARRTRDLNSAFAALERAHVLGQRYLVAHIATHIRMFRIGLARRDFREMAGQILRLIATIPGYLTGWVPKGNTGGANVSAIKPMSLDPEVEPLLHDFRVWRDVTWRAALYASVVLAGFLALAVIESRRTNAAAVLDATWERRTVARLEPLPSTAFLEVLPVVNFHAAPGLKSEPGVSYLIRTDRHTVLFDLGFNRAQESPSPLEHNLAALDVSLNAIDAVFISHAHRDHVGGTAFERALSFSFGIEQKPLPATLKVLTPVSMRYPGKEVQTASEPATWLPAMATTGPIPRQLVLGRIDEQALVIHVAGRGLVAIVGCGHQTIPKLVAHIRATFQEPLIGIVGDLHYPVPKGRLFIAGIDAQRRLASGKGLWETMEFDQATAELAVLQRELQFLVLGSHDTSDEVHQHAEHTWGPRFQRAMAGKPLCIENQAGSALRPGRCRPSAG